MFRLLFGFLFLPYSFVTAQTTRNDSLRIKYNNQTIYRYGNVYLKGVERISYQELAKEFSMSDLGLAAYEKSRKYKKTSTIFRYLSLASGLAAVGVAAQGNNRNLAYGFLGGQILFSFGTLRFNGLSNQSLDRALWQRNKDLLFPTH